MLPFSWLFQYGVFVDIVLTKVNKLCGSMYVQTATRYRIVVYKRVALRALRQNVLTKFQSRVAQVLSQKHRQRLLESTFRRWDRYLYDVKIERRQIQRADNLRDAHLKKRAFFTFVCAVTMQSLERIQ